MILIPQGSLACRGLHSAWSMPNQRLSLGLHRTSTPSSARYSVLCNVWYSTPHQKLLAWPPALRTPTNPPTPHPTTTTHPQTIMFADQQVPEPAAERPGGGNREWQGGWCLCLLL